MDLHKHLLHCRRALLAAPALLLAADLPAAGPQAVDDAAPAAGTVAPSRPLRSAFGAALADGEVVAGGPDWKARFPAGRAVFTPALGVRAERAMPFSFAFEAVERGADTLAAADGAPAELAGQRVSFAHAGGVVERYDATVDGLAQSFLVPEHPGGAGDLVVRGRIETELSFAGPLPGGGLSFELPGAGGVSVGGVTAVDALGATAPGELRLDGDRLELVVPGAFVDAAAYPLVIDPELGAVIPIQDGTYDDGDPDVAAGSHSNTRYLVVWERRFALNDVDIRGIRLDENGDPVGSLLFLENGDELSNSPAAAYQHLDQRFFVAWQETPGIFSPFQIVGRGVDADDGALSAKLAVSPSPNQQLAPDVGGERTTADNDVLVVWSEGDLGIRGRQVSLPAGGAISTFGSTLQISDPGDMNTSPAISKSAGDAGRFLIAWQSGSGNVHCRLFTRNGIGVGDSLDLHAVAPEVHFDPACDGDGTNFLVAIESGEAGGWAPTDITVVSLTYTGAELEANAVAVVEGDLGDEEENPEVAYTGGQYLVSYLDVDAGTANAYAEVVDPFTCLACEGDITLSATGGEDSDVRIAAHYAAGLDTDEALHVWETFEGDGDVLGQLFDSPDGSVNLAGACGDGGAAHTPCPYAGNGNFAFHLGGAQPFAPAFVALAFQESAFGCGTCTLWPSLATADVFYAGLTDAHGRASLPVALPPGTGGVVFTSQWAVSGPGAACPFFGVDVSDGVRTTIQP